MGVMQIKMSDENERLLRRANRRKGDISRLTNESVAAYMKNYDVAAATAII